ncbi:MAG: hypothetical protein H7Y17_15720, partial [Chlorobia bacterium]|nr:hypothetical protein [Fimbriimonadaceae bacterium]
VTALVLHHAKDLNLGSRKPRVAESDQLAATASLNMVLRHQVLPGRQGEADSRLVTLYCTGRGRFGNQTVTMRSRGPLDYAVTKPPVSSAPVVLNSDEQKVVEFLQGRPKTSGQIGTLMGEISDEALRSLLTRLRTKGAIRLVKSEKRPRRWRVVS